MKKKIATAAAVLAVLLIVAFQFGRRSVRVRTVEKERVVTQVKVETKVVKVVEDKKRDEAVKETKTVTRRDGTRIVVVRESASTTTTATKTDVAKAATSTVRVEERVRVVSGPRTRDNWSVGVTGGLETSSFLGHPGKSYVPGVPEYVSVGIGVGKRVLGPIWVDVNVTSRGAVGIGARVTW